MRAKDHEATTRTEPRWSARPGAENLAPTTAAGDRVGPVVSWMTGLVRDDATVAHRHDAIGVGGDARIVGDDDDRNTMLAIQRAQHVHDLVRRP
jgi:hypothetical protein